MDLNWNETKVNSITCFSPRLSRTRYKLSHDISFKDIQDYSKKTHFLCSFQIENGYYISSRSGYFSLHGDPRKLSWLNQGTRGTDPSASDSETRHSLTQEKGHHPTAHRIQWIDADLDLVWVKKEKSDSSNSSSSRKATEPQDMESSSSSCAHWHLRSIG